MFHRLLAVQIPICRGSRGVLLNLVGDGEAREVGKQVGVWSEVRCLHTYIHACSTCRYSCTSALHRIGDGAHVYRYSYTEPGATRSTNTATTTSAGDDDDDEGMMTWFPTSTWKTGPPEPLCRSGCGRPCLLFCDRPCLLDCIDGGFDFPEPKNSSPPPRPTPLFRRDPQPTKKPVPASTVPPDPKGTDPQDEEQEDDD